MPSFEIPDGPTAVALKNQLVKGQNIRAGSAMFSVTNKSGQPLAGRVSVQPQGDAKAEWFELQGEKERNFAGNETQKITINIKAPPAAVVGDYKFRFRVVNVNDPDNDYTDSAVVTFSVTAVPKPEPSKVPWLWIILGIVLLLVIVGGVVAWLLLSGPSTPSQVAVPDVVGKTYTDAAKKITDAGLTAKKTDDTTPGKTPGTVVTEKPVKGTQVDSGSTVTLSVAKGTVLPDMRNKSFDAAKQQLEDAGFTVTASPQTGTPKGAQPGTVIDSTPAVGATVGAGQSVTLTIDPGVNVPNVVGSTLGSVATNLNKNFNVVVTVSADGGTTDVIASQNPASGTVEKGHNLNLTVHGPKCTFITCRKFIKVPYSAYQSQMHNFIITSP